MTDDDPVADGGPVADDGPVADGGSVDASVSRTATVRTTHAAADRVVDALAPDNTDSMAMRAEGDVVTCRIERSSTGGLRSTVDDYVVNLQVADALIERARAHRSTNTSGGGDSADADAFGGDGPRANDADRSRPDPGTRSEPTDGDRPRTNGSDDNT